MCDKGQKPRYKEKRMEKKIKKSHSRNATRAEHRIVGANSPQIEQFFSLILGKISVQQNKKFSRPCIFEGLYHGVLSITCTEQHNK